MWSIRQVVSLGALLLVAIGVALMVRLSLPYAAMRPGIGFLQTKGLVYGIAIWRLSFYIHVFTSVIALVAGALQFISWLGRHYPAAHRRLGYAYVAVVAGVSGPASLVMGWYANGGLQARISFVVLALLWIFTTVMGLLYAVCRQWVAHVRWLARSYALTLSALTLRLYALLLAVGHVQLRPATAYILIAWASWTINLLVAELWLARGGAQRQLQRMRPSPKAL